jgi:hypothetical protein
MGLNMKLPDNLKEALNQIVGPCVLATSINYLPAFIVRDKRRELRNLKGKDVPIAYQPQAGFFDTGAIFRMYIEVRHDPDKPYRGECFLDPDSVWDLQILLLFASAKHINYYFVDEQSLVVAVKQIPTNEEVNSELRDMVLQAVDHNKGLEKIDYLASRQRFMLETHV